jgi:hypothetical protein
MVKFINIAVRYELRQPQPCGIERPESDLIKPSVRTVPAVCRNIESTGPEKAEVYECGVLRPLCFDLDPLICVCGKLTLN